MEKNKTIEARTSEKAKAAFIKTLKAHDKTQSYLVNLLVDAYTAEPLKCIIALEEMKASKLWK